MRNNKTWTKSEVKICLTIIKNNPDNLSKAFKEAAEKIDRTPKAIESAYYKKDRSLYRFAKGRNLFSLSILSSISNFFNRNKNKQVKNNINK